MDKTPKFKIVPMTFPDDKNQLVGWETKYRGTEKFESIAKYILENDTYHGLDEVITTNFERFNIGDDEIQFSFVAKDDGGRVLAWILMDAFDVSTSSPRLFLQYLMIHPELQHSHLGTEIFKEMLSKPKKYIGVKPKEFFGYIQKSNTASQNLMKKFGFKFKEMNEEYVKAYTDQPRFEQASNPQALGE